MVEDGYSTLLKKWNAFTPGPIVPVNADTAFPIYMHRLDQVQSWADGNKYYKLKYTLHEAIYSGITHLVSKGGMFSNHLAALAAACAVFGLKCTAVIRSYTSDEQNPSIQQLRHLGCEVLYLNPEQYKAFDGLACEKAFPDALFIPEGGLSVSGIRGTAEISSEWNIPGLTHVVVPAGTMGTAAGILSTTPAHIHVIIVPSWKGCSTSYVSDILSQYDIHPACTWEVWADYHFGGFGKFTPALPVFMTSFFKTSGLALDPVYTGKMMFAVEDRMRQGYFAGSDRILALHTGGHQGIAGFRYRYPDVWTAYADLVNAQHALPR